MPRKSQLVEYDPEKHVRPMTERERCSTYDALENAVRQFVAEQIGDERFEELDEEGDQGLNDLVKGLMDDLSDLCKTPQQKYDMYPYNLGDEDEDNLNFYDPDNHEKPLGRIKE